MAAIASGRHRMIGPLLLLLAIFFPFTFVFPLLTTRVPLISYNEIILVRVAYDLFFIDKFLFVIVFIFGMLMPACKMLLSIVCWYRLGPTFTRRWSASLAMLSKLSMLDIMLLAIFIVAFKGIGLGVVQIKYGLYFYVVVVVSSLFLNLAMASMVESIDRKNHPTTENEHST